METGTKVLIGVGIGIAVGVGIYFATRTTTEKIGEKKADEDSDKIPLINEIVNKMASRTKFKDEASKKEIMKKEYNFWLTKTLKEVEEKLKRVNGEPLRG